MKGEILFQEDFREATARVRVHCDQLAERKVDDVRERKTAGKDAALLSLNAGICIQDSPVLLDL